jgi:hypothetical protein
VKREVLKVFCCGRRNHEIGAVVADAHGYAVEYTAKVVRPGSVFASTRRVVDRLNRDESASLGGYCRSCNRPVTLSVRAMLRAADGGIPGYHAPFTDKDRGDDVRLRLKHDPRGPLVI